MYHLWRFPLVETFEELGIGRLINLPAYGVDLFFVISGFLIGRILLEISSSAGIKAFYIRRLLRIWPLYYLLLFLVYLALPDKNMFADAPYWSFTVFIFNFWESFGGNVNELIGPLWSIAIEEQFYMIGPFMFLLIKRKPLTFFLISYGLLSPFLRLALIYNTEIDIWRFTPTRIDGICIGLLLSIFLSSRKNIMYIRKRIKFFSRLTLLLLCSLPLTIIIFPDFLWKSLGYSLVTLAFGFTVLVVQVRNSAGEKVGFLHWNFLRYLGVRCYSIYLFHIFFPCSRKVHI